MSSPARDISQENAIHKHAFWLYGVLVGVALKQALETSISHFIEPQRLLHELEHIGLTPNFPHTQIGLYPEIIRLTVFIVLVIRFYFGSAFFFGAAYESEKARIKFPVRNYGVDFIFGFIHFVGFNILALSIDIHTTSIHAFPYLVGFILIYDVFWYISSMRRSTHKMIFWWMIVNLLTALFGAVVYLIVELKYNNVIRAEECAFWIVILVSLLDIGMMMAKRPFFRPIGRIVPHDDDSEPPATVADAAEPIPE